MRRAIIFLTTLFLCSAAFAEEYIKKTPSAFTFQSIYDGLYLKLDCSNDPLTNTLDGSKFDFTGHCALGADASVNPVLYILNMDETYTHKTGTRYGYWANIDSQPSDALTATTVLMGGDYQSEWNGGVDGSVLGYMIGFKGEGNNITPAQGINTLTGVYGVGANLGGGTAANAYGVRGDIQNNDGLSYETGNITKGSSLVAGGYTDKGTGIIVTRNGLEIEDITGGGLVTNQNGIYCPALTAGGTTNYFIKNVSAPSDFGSGILTTTGYVEADGGFLAVGTTTGYTLPSGAGTRFMWIPNKYAFRAGTVIGTEWDAANIGNYSFSCGYGTTASGTNSIAMGVSAVASDSFATAMGNHATASSNDTVALGYYATAADSYAIAIGENSSASGSKSIAIGSHASASGIGAIAIGKNNISSGNYSYSSGLYIKSTGTGAISQGYNANFDSSSFISGTGIANVGYSQIAMGYASSGNTLKAEGTGSVAIGQDVNALTNNNILCFGRAFSQTTANTFNIGFGQLDYEFSATAADFKDSSITTSGTLGAGATTLTGDLTFADGVDRIIKIADQTVVDLSGNSLSFYSGLGNGVGNGGQLLFYAGNGGLDGGTGGGLQFFSGNAQAGDTNGGNLYFYAGLANGTGTNGSFTMEQGDGNNTITLNDSNGIKFFNYLNNYKFTGNTNFVILDTSLITTSDKTFTFPDASGTLAITGAGVSQNWLTTGTLGAGAATVTTLNTPLYANSFAVPPTAVVGNDYTGCMGFEFRVSSDVVVSKLGRLYTSSTHNHLVKLWSTDGGGTLITSGTILAASSADADGFKWIDITPVTLYASKTYRIATDLVNGEDARTDYWYFANNMRGIFYGLTGALGSTGNYPNTYTKGAAWETPAVYFEPVKTIDASGNFEVQGNVAGNNFHSLSLTTASITLASGMTIANFGAGSWIDMPTSGPSGIGVGGVGSNPWLAYANNNGSWFTNSIAGDLAYRNTGTGALLLGNTANNADLVIRNSRFLFGQGTADDGSTLIQANGSISIDSDTAFLKLGEGQDGKLIHNGSGIILQSDVVTAGDYLQLRGGTNGIDFNIGATEQITLVDGAILPTTTNDIDIGDSDQLIKDIWQIGKHYFRDAAIYSWSSADGWLNLVADTGVEINAPILNTADLSVSGDATLGGATTDIVNFVAGDTGGTPANGTTPSKWINIEVQGAQYYIPVYS